MSVTNQHILLLLDNWISDGSQIFASYYTLSVLFYLFCLEILMVLNLTFGLIKNVQVSVGAPAIRQ